MTTGIIAALKEELAPLLEQAEIARRVEAFGTTFHQGTLKGQSVVLCECGVATVNAALCTGVALREFGAGAIINTGIAGAMGGGVRTLDVVISDEAVYHDRDTPVLEKYFPYTTAFRADPGLIERARRAAAGLAVHGRPVRAHVGRVATGDWYICDSAMKRAVIEKAHPLCADMEGAAIANAAYAAKVPFVIIRTMSDSADEGANESYDNLIGDASGISAAIVLHMLEG